MNTRLSTKATKLFFLLLYGIFFFASFRTVHASTFSEHIGTSLQVVSASQVQVVQTYTLSWDNSSQFFPASKNSIEAHVYPPLVGQTKNIASLVKNLKVTNQRGNTIPFSTSVKDEVFYITIPYYDDLSSGTDLVFKISYTTSLYVAQEGGLIDVRYAGLSKDFKRSEYYAKGRYTQNTSMSLDITIPKSLGGVASSSPTPYKTSSHADATTVSYTDSDLIDKAVRISVGDKRLVKFTLSGKTYATNTNSPDFVQGLFVNHIDIALPTQRSGTEFANQTIYYTKIEPFPESLTVDADGNLIARLPVSAAKNGTITIEGYAVIKSASFPESIKKAKINDIPATMSPYLASEATYWQVTDPAIQTLAKQNLDKSGLQFHTLEQSLGYVSRTISYADVTSVQALQRQGALGALQSKKGVCMEYSDLLLSILRAQGIPTRTVFGDGVGTQVDKTLQGIGHQWVGVWFPEAGWVPVDPTWSDSGKEYIGPDFDHFVWYVASKSVNEPSGFHCQSLDAQTPCRDALSIETEPVNALPDLSQVQTVEQIIQKVDSSKHQGSAIQQFLQQIVTYLGTSYVGRIMLSTQGLLFMSAVFLYVFLVATISRVVTYIKKKRKVGVIK